MKPPGIVLRLLGNVVEVCCASAGADRATLVVEKAGQLRARVSVSGDGVVTDVPLTTPVPAPVIAEAFATGASVLLEEVAGRAELAALLPAVGSLLVVPVRGPDGASAALCLEHGAAAGVFTAERVRLVEGLARQLPILLEEERRPAERVAEGGIRFLADAGAVLAESLDYRATLARVARLAVDSLADWCVMDVVEDGVMRRVAAAHREPERERALIELRQLQERHGPPQTSRALDGGKPLAVLELTEEASCKYITDPVVLGLLRRIGFGSSMMLALRTRDWALGSITLVRGGRRYTEQELALGQELARRAAIAIDNARLYHEAQEAVRAREDFLSIASHELNTPIGAIELAAQTLEERSRGREDDSGEGGAAHRTAGPAAERAGGPAARRDPHPVGRAAAAARAAGAWRAGARDGRSLRAGDRARRCAVAIEAPGPVVGNWDWLRVEQVITNLLSNAIKFSRGRPISVTVTQAGEVGRLVVEDCGIGIPPERLPYIFGRFERAVPASHFGGLGLGLYIVHQIVSALGGATSVTSELGVGSRFTHRPAARPCRREGRGVTMRDWEPLPSFILTGARVRLEPLALGHTDALWAAADGPRGTFALTSVPASRAEARGYIEGALALRDAGAPIPSPSSIGRGRVVGSTRFGNVERWPGRRVCPPPAPARSARRRGDRLDLASAQRAQRTGLNSRGEAAAPDPRVRDLAGATASP